MPHTCTHLVEGDRVRGAGVTIRIDLDDTCSLAAAAEGMSEATGNAATCRTQPQGVSCYWWLMLEADLLLVPHACFRSAPCPADQPRAHGWSSRQQCSCSLQQGLLPLITSLSVRQLSHQLCSSAVVSLQAPNAVRGQSRAESNPQIMGGRCRPAFSVHWLAAFRRVQTSFGNLKKWCCASVWLAVLCDR